MFGHTFTSQYGTEPSGVAGDTWAAVLAGLSGEQLARGLREVVKLGSDWPPSAPRFRMLCLDIPTLAAVRQEFKNADGAHRSPFARKLWQFIDSYQLGRADQDKADRMFRDAYDLTREHVMNGGALDPAPVAALETEKPAAPKPATPEKVRRHLEEIDRLLNPPVFLDANLQPPRPSVVDITKRVDMAGNRVFVFLTLSDSRIVQHLYEGDIAIDEETMQNIITREIDKLMEQNS